MLTKNSVLLATLVASLLAVPAAQAAGDPARGNELRGECSDCHGEDFLGDEEFPRLAGLDEAYLLEQLRLIKSGERSERAEMMLWFFEDLDDQDLQDLAAYFATLPAE